MGTGNDSNGLQRQMTHHECNINVGNIEMGMP